MQNQWNKPKYVNNRRKKYVGMNATGVKRLKALEEENHKLKRMSKELALNNQKVSTSLFLDNVWF
ncbi:MAG: hypothetical protein ACI9QN_001345 [Arcticibacterium sp.]|jgi:hypothetical protein